MPFQPGWAGGPGVPPTLTPEERFTRHKSDLKNRFVAYLRRVPEGVFPTARQIAVNISSINVDQTAVDTAVSYGLDRERALEMTRLTRLTDQQLNHTQEIIDLARDTNVVSQVGDGWELCSRAKERAAEQERVRAKEERAAQAPALAAAQAALNEEEQELEWIDRAAERLRQQEEEAQRQKEEEAQRRIYERRKTKQEIAEINKKREREQEEQRVRDAEERAIRDANEAKQAELDKWKREWRNTQDIESAQADYAERLIPEMQESITKLAIDAAKADKALARQRKVGGKLTQATKIANAAHDAVLDAESDLRDLHKQAAEWRVYRERDRARGYGVKAAAEARQEGKTEEEAQALGRAAQEAQIAAGRPAYDEALARIEKWEVEKAAIKAAALEGHEAFKAEEEEAEDED